MKTDIAVKQEHIIDSAIRRFSYFGVAKTTLTEIADELGITKQALAYYFPEKQSLVLAVQERISLEYIDSIRQAFENASTVQEALELLVAVKANFIEKYYMLANQADSFELLSKTTTRSWKEPLRQQELQLLTALFEKGIGNGELKPIDTVQHAELFFDTMYAFSRCIRDKGIVPDQEAFDDLATRQLHAISLFYEALRSETWKS